ncbi:MAG: helix-turn-helix transcriptional regulator [Pirellulales bacterium]
MQNLEPIKIQQRFGERVRELRVERQLSQEKLGFAAQLDRTYIVSVEQGRRNVSLVNIVRIANALGVSPVELFIYEQK